MRIYSLALLLLALGLIGCAGTSTETSNAEYQKGQNVQLTEPQILYKEAMLLFKEGKKAESAISMKKAADAGLPAAQMMTGMNYRDGNGLKLDSQKSIDYFRMAALQGHPLAMYELAHALSETMIFKSDEPTEQTLEAIKWYKRAAEYDLVDAQYNYASWILQDVSNPENKSEAYLWYKIAAQNGDTQSLEKANYIKDNFLTSEKATELDRKAFEFIPKKIPPEMLGKFD